MIVDAHVHLGPCRIFDADVSEEALLANLDRNGIDVAIVQPFPGAPEPRAVHDRIGNLAAKHPGRIYGLASVSPHCEHDVYYREIERCVRELHFVGVKLHTIGHAVNPLHRDGQLVFDTARALEIPVMIHTGMGVPFALPTLALPRAHEYPDVPIVLAHAGHGVYTQEAQIVASAVDNVYLETSWIGTVQIARLLQTLGPERIMMGTDILLNAASELAKYRSLDLAKDVEDAVLAGTARHVFRLG